MSELPPGWIEVSIADVTLPIMSIDPTKMPEQEFRYADIGSIDNKNQTITDPKSFLGRDAPSRARRLIRTGDTLFSTVRTYLKNIALVTEDLDGQLTSTGIAVLRSTGAVDAGYLFRWACSDDFVAPLSRAQDGTMYPAVSDRDVGAAPIPLPPLAEQGRIVAKIGNLTGKSKRARDHLDHVPHLVEKYKQAALAAAFAGKLTPEADPSLFSHFPLAKVTSSTFYGPRIAKEAYVASGVPTLRTTDIADWGRLVPKSPPQVAVSDTEFAKWRFENGDLMVTRTGATIGKCAVYEAAMGRALPSAYLIRVRLKQEEVDPRFAVLFLLSAAGQRQLLDGRTAVAQPNINADAITSVQLPLPPVVFQQAIVKKVDALFARIDRLALEATGARRLLDRFDQAMLAKALRGELVPQDPDDEPANELLDRIRAERGAAPKVKRGRKAKEA